MKDSDWSDDPHTESRLREDLYNGNVRGAKEWLRQIEDPALREHLRQVIEEYDA